MMKRKNFLYLATALTVAFLSVCFTSCDKDDDWDFSASDIEGTWYSLDSYKVVELTTSSFSSYTLSNATDTWTANLDTQTPYSLSWNPSDGKYGMWTTDEDPYAKTKWAEITMGDNSIHLVMLSSSTEYSLQRYKGDLKELLDYLNSLQK